jgi:hypothetical protein
VSSILAPTEINAVFKGHMRMAQEGLLYNNQRKIAFDSVKQRYLFSYSSNGNVYYASSTDNSHPYGCKWNTERRINAGYGNSINPSVAWIPPHSAGDSGHVVVVWEDSMTATNSQRYIRYTVFNHRDSTTGGGTIGFPAQNGAFNSDHPAAPSVCAIRPSHPNLPSSYGTFYGDAVVVWSMSDSIAIGIVDPTCPTDTSPNNVEVIPSTKAGTFVSIEPGFNRVTDTSRHDPVDFELTYQDSAGIEYRYLNLNCRLFSKKCG